MFIMPTLRQRFSAYRKTKKKKARQKKVAAEQRAIDAAAHSADRLELYRLLQEYADATNQNRPRLVAPPEIGRGRGRNKRKTQRKREYKKSDKTRRRTPTPVRHYPSPQNLRLKKLLITALASSPGITPFKPNPLQRGESGVRDIDYDSFRNYHISKPLYKVGKEYAKSYARHNAVLKPDTPQFLPVVEEPFATTVPSRY